MTDEIGTPGEISCLLKDQLRELGELAGELCGAVHHNDTRIKQTLEALAAEREKFQGEKDAIKSAAAAFENRIARASLLVEDSWRKRFLDGVIAGVSGAAALLLILYLLQKFAHIHFFVRLGQ